MMKNKSRRRGGFVFPTRRTMIYSDLSVWRMKIQNTKNGVGPACSYSKNNIKTVRFKKRVTMIVKNVKLQVLMYVRVSFSKNHSHRKATRERAKTSQRFSR